MFLDILGIDIGAESVKLALMSKGRIKKTAELFYPEGMFHEGWVADPEKMGGMIRAAMRKHGLRANRAAVQLAGEQTYVHTASMPIMSEKQLRLNLRFAFTDYINDNLNFYAYDYAMLDTIRQIKENLAAPPREEEEKTMDLLAVAAPLKLIEQARDMMESAKLFLSCAAPPECSCAALIRSDQAAGADPGREYCILDLGWRAVRMYMFKGERHIVTRALETGMRALEVPVAHACGVRQEESRDMLRNNQFNCQQADECVAVYNDIALELMRSINFYKFSHQDSTVSDIWLIGGGAAVVPLAEILEKTLEMRVHLGDRLVPGGRAVEHCHSFVLAAGAALC